MSASSLQPMRDVCFYVSGHVTVHPDAAIAPNVLLQADPGSQLIIHAGVSLGAGSILHAHGGTLEIGENATIGNQVLVVGHGSVGECACVGAFSTLMLEIDVADRQVLPPSSLLGDASRKVVIHHASEPMADSTVADSSESGDRPPSPGVQAEPSEPAEQESEEAIAPDTSTSEPQKNGQVYGRAAFEQMIRVMFPARQYQFGTDNGSNSNGRSAAGSASNPESHPSHNDHQNSS